MVLACGSMGQANDNATLAEKHVNNREFPAVMTLQVKIKELHWDMQKYLRLQQLQKIWLIGETFLMGIC